MKTVDISKYSNIDTSEMQELVLAPLPDIVADRVLQLDADIACYECTYNENESLEECKNNLLTLIEKYRVYAGAERVVCHLTGKLKGNRYNIATVKPYQGNRTGKAKPKNLKKLRDYLTSYVSSTVSVFFNELEEADDSLTQFHHNNPNSVLCSRDKDLRMNSGLHLNWDTLELHEVDPFGYLEIKEYETKSGTKKRKIYGEGTLWFWFQMLAGDTADNIAGLPMIQGKTKMVKCGDIRAYEAITDYLDVDYGATNYSLYRFVLTLYKDYYVDDSEYGRTEEVAEAMFIEQAKLLWMRRHVGEDDVLNWFKEIGYLAMKEYYEK